MSRSTMILVAGAFALLAIPSAAAEGCLVSAEENEMDLHGGGPTYCGPFFCPGPLWPFGPVTTPGFCVPEP